MAGLSGDQWSPKSPLGSIIRAKDAPITQEILIETLVPGSKNIGTSALNLLLGAYILKHEDVTWKITLMQQ